MVRRGRLRPAVIAVDMVVAAGLASIDEITTYVAHPSPRGPAYPCVARRSSLAIDHSRSPQESRMRLIWILDAELPPPLCNRAVFDLDGRLLGYPDLFDPIAGVVGEYAGADHRDPDRHRADVVREELFRDHGLECFTVVGEDMHNHRRVAERMLAARAPGEVPASRVLCLDPRSPAGLVWLPLPIVRYENAPWRAARKGIFVSDYRAQARARSRAASTWRVVQGKTGSSTSAWWMSSSSSVQPRSHAAGAGVPQLVDEARRRGGGCGSSTLPWTSSS